MKLTITSVDYNPPELTDQVPFNLSIIRMLPGPDRPDYWLGKLDKPIRWISDKHEREVEYLTVCARWQGTQIEPNISDMPIGIAYVVDPTQVDDRAVDFEKCKYVAIGVASEVEGTEAPAGLTGIIAGRIARAFGMGK